jgi:hypothetical protein
VLQGEVRAGKERAGSIAAADCKNEQYISLTLELAFRVELTWTAEAAFGGARVDGGEHVPALGAFLCDDAVQDEVISVEQRKRVSSSTATHSCKRHIRQSRMRK